MPCSPLSRSCCETSRTVTWQPDCAATCAMPEPIRPHPTTPTFSIGMQLASESVLILRDCVLRLALALAELCMWRLGAQAGVPAPPVFQLPCNCLRELLAMRL